MQHARHRADAYRDTRADRHANRAPSLGHPDDHADRRADSHIGAGGAYSTAGAYQHIRAAGHA